MTTKRKSKITDEAEVRIAALSTIAPRLKFPDSLTMQGYVTAAADARVLIARLNAIDANRETVRSTLNRKEAELAILSSRVLKAVRAQFGPDSEEHATAGGTRPTRRTGTPSKPEPATQPTAPIA